jgi:hypothetical protein
VLILNSFPKELLNGMQSLLRAGCCDGRNRRHLS